MNRSVSQNEKNQMNLFGKIENKMKNLSIRKNEQMSVEFVKRRK